VAAPAPSRPRRYLLFAAGALLLGLSGLAAMSWLRVPVGPLVANDRFDVRLALAQGETATWGSVLPRNPTNSPIAIQAIEPVNATGLTIVGLLMSDPDVDGGIGTAAGFPPAGIRGSPVAGTVLTAAGATPTFRQVLIGVRLSGSQEGRIGGLRVRYEFQGRVYETVLPFGLTVVAASQ